MKSTAARTARSTRPTLVTAKPAGPLRTTPQELGVVSPYPEYVVRAEQAVQLESLTGDDGTPQHRWMDWVVTVTYRHDYDEAGELVPSACVRLSAERPDYEVRSATRDIADITGALGILSIEEFRAVVTGLSALAATLPTEAPFARAAAAERGE